MKGISSMKILRGKSGVSMIFVLAVMLMLLSIGVSALTAASLNFGAGIAQRERSQANLYVSSMEQTVYEALQIGDVGDKVDDLESLGGLILLEVLESALDIEPELDNMEIYKSGRYRFDSLNLTVSPPAALSDSRLEDYEIDIEVMEPITGEPEISVTANKPIINKNFNGTVFEFSDRTLQTVTVNGRIKVTQTTNYMARNEYIITTETIYRLEGCVLTEDASGSDNETELEDFSIKNHGEWILEKYETISDTED